MYFNIQEKKLKPIESVFAKTMTRKRNKKYIVYHSNSFKVQTILSSKIDNKFSFCN